MGRHLSSRIANALLILVGLILFAFFVGRPLWGVVSAKTGEINAQATATAIARTDNTPTPTVIKAQATSAVVAQGNTPTPYPVQPTYTPYPTQQAPTATPTVAAPTATSMPITPIPTVTTPKVTPTNTPVPPAANAGGGKTQGSCEGMNDYGLANKEETSASAGMILFQYYREGENFEHNSWLPAGRYTFNVRDINGHAWEIGPSCSPDDFQTRHLTKSIDERRGFGANNLGYVYYMDLVNSGLISIAAQNKPVIDPPHTIAGYMNLSCVTTCNSPKTGGTSQTGPAAVTTPANTGTTAPPSGGSCVELDNYPVQPQGPSVVTKFESKDNWMLILLWSNATNPILEHKIYVLAPNQTLPVVGGGGTVINFSCQSAAMSRVDIEKKKGFSELTDVERARYLR